MVFSSHLFIFYYLPPFLLLYYILPFRARTWFIALASYMFYAWANPMWAALMFMNSGIDYLCGLALVRLSGLPWEGKLPPIIPEGFKRTRAMLAVLAVSITSNLSLLAYFKYYMFTQENINAISNAFGGPSLLPYIQVALPIGISFYTFKSMSYAIDVYRGDARPMTNFIDYCCFEAFFPDLVAGPIIRYASIERQMRSRTHTYEKFGRGVAMFGLGMAKKILIANPLAQAADAAFAAGALHWYDAWYGVMCYAFQIYFDFSGYSDMAVGLALMMGFVLMQNFNSPYKADSITEFWHRWHISLSTWLRDYLYITLGGNRKGRARTYINLMLVMLVGGLWHGASWNFVIWGAIHGGMLAFERLQGKNSTFRQHPRPVRVALTFAIVCITWVFFRADTLPAAGTYIGAMFGFGTALPSRDVVAAILYAPYQLLVFVVAALLVWGCPNSWQLTDRIPARRALWIAALLVLSIALMWTQTENPFIYFQF